jgi:sialate O-acetylesterase
MAVGRETWGHFRDSQRRLMYEIPNSGMAVSSDLGDSTDVHPREKRQIGERLARWALNKTYGVDDIIPSGPLFHDFFIENDTVYLSFEYAEGLRTSDGKAPRSFELAEFPGLYYPADTVIEGNVIKVTSSKVKTPRYVRYGWSSFSDGNLINIEGLPASTFSTQFNNNSR